MSPQVVMSPSDLGKLYQAASAIGNPIAIAGRVAGLGQDEQRAGIPAWAWIAVALGAGLVIGIQYGPKLKSYAPNRQFLRSVRYAR